MGIGGDSFHVLVQLAEGLGLPGQFEEAFDVGNAVKREINRLRRLAGEPEPFKVDEDDE